jgi:hypothetical protein
MQLYKLLMHLHEYTNEFHTSNLHLASRHRSHIILAKKKANAISCTVIPLCSHIINNYAEIVKTS